MARRVAITGLGLVTPLGTNVSSTWEGLLAGRSGAGPITRFDPVQSPVKFACEVKGFDPAQYLDKKEIRRYDLFAQYAIGAAEQAVTDACLASNWSAADLMIAGGAEAAITPLAVASFANMKALSERNDDPRTASRPFDKDRDGFVMGDGAAVLVLEEWEHARRRGAKLYAEVAGYGMTADAYHITAPAPDGSGAQDAMRLAMQDAGVKPEQIGYINAHGTSTPHGDAAETAAVKAVFGAQARKLVFGSTKSMTGHLLGAAGALEAAVCALVVQTGTIPPTITQSTPDPACDPDSAANKAVRRPVDIALSNSFGFGGHNVTLAIKRAA